MAPDSTRVGMRSVRLGRSDLRTPSLIFGCGNFGGIGSAAEAVGLGDDESTAYSLLDRALDAGITMFDTADSYGGGRSEEWLGRWMACRGVRAQVMVTTKVGNRVGPGEHDAGLSRRHIRAQIEASLRRLQTDYVDLYLTHVADPHTPIEETVTAFDELVHEGKIRYYGLSNVSGQLLADTVATATLAGVGGPVNMQGGYHLLDRGHEAGAIPASEHYGVGFTAFSPLAGGLLTGRYQPGAEPPAGSRGALLPDWHSTVDPVHFTRVLYRLRQAAARRDLAPATLALAWVLTAPKVRGAVIAPRTPHQLELVRAAVEVSLTDPEREWLASGEGEEIR
ncbi:aldo/keto reductase [Actinoplanes sp. NPDC023936]|uniref:aldo/keto reductase n=1 Tax=Actinoplanes sp. NPDC023936 TaxID=3154910 RepID=UPI0033DE5A9B